MSDILFTKRGTPATPSSGKSKVFVASDDRLATVSDAGVVRKMLEESSSLFRLRKLTVVSAGTTSYTPMDGVDALFVECVGGGGAGGDSYGGADGEVSVGGGGGAGAYSCLFTTTIKTFTVAVGAGGATGGTSGGDTTFDSPSICTAKGGGGASSLGSAASISEVAGGAGGLASGGVGDFKCDGSGDGSGLRFSGTIGLSGYGAPGPFGGMASHHGVSANGTNGGQYGAGGSGAFSRSPGGGDKTAGHGADGVIRVLEYQALS